MASTYVRRFNLKSSLSNKQVNDFWKALMREFIPAIQKVKGVRSCKVYSGAGALRADIRLVAEMDDAGVYETLLRDSCRWQATWRILWGYGPDHIDPDVHSRSDTGPAEGAQFVSALFV